MQIGTSPNLSFEVKDYSGQAVHAYLAWRRSEMPADGIQGKLREESGGLLHMRLQAERFARHSCGSRQRTNLRRPSSLDAVTWVHSLFVCHQTKFESLQAGDISTESEVPEYA